MCVYLVYVRNDPQCYLWWRKRLDALAIEKGRDREKAEEETGRSRSRWWLADVAQVWRRQWTLPEVGNWRRHAQVTFAVHMALVLELIVECVYIYSIIYICLSRCCCAGKLEHLAMQAKAKIPYAQKMVCFSQHAHWGKRKWMWMNYHDSICPDATAIFHMVW